MAMVTNAGRKKRALIVPALVVSALFAPGAVVASRAQNVVDFFGGTTTTTLAPVDSSVPQSPEASPPSTDTPPTTIADPPPTVPTVPPSLPAPEVPLSPIPGELPVGGGDNTEIPEEQSGGFPAELQAMTDSIQRSRSNSTQALLEMLAPSIQYGVTPEQAVSAGFGRFPIGGFATYSHDWWFPRFGPVWRLHQGTDIFAAFNTPVRAPANGHIRITNGGLGGLAVYVVEPNGTYWYMAHLAGLAPNIVEGTQIAVGQIVGYVGDSGNAKGGMPHVHLEIHPMGGPPVDPKATLDQFIEEAVAGVPQLLATFAHQAAAAAAAAAELEKATLATVPPAPTLDGPGRAALLWASSVSPAGGAVEIVEAEAQRVATSFDWRRHEIEQLEAGWKRLRESGIVQAWLTPLTPPQLSSLLGPIK